MKKALQILVYTVLAYLLIALVINVLPAGTPDFATVFRANTVYGNKAQGNEAVVLGYKDGNVTILSTVLAHAPGPPEHVHTNFDEVFSVATGQLSLLLNGEKKVLKAGESFTVPRGTYHKFFNETNQPVTGMSEVPAGFAFALTQLYGVSRDNPVIFQSPRLLLQLSAWGSGFDSYLKDGPPPFIVKTLKFMLLPVARLSGYQYANPAYYPQSVSGRIR